MTYRYESLHILASVFGWIYFTAWSVSFYPQTILNWQRKRVDGLSFDYLMYNIQGFLCFPDAAYNIVNYIEQRNHDLTKSVDPNDIAFAAHAVLLTSIQIFQCTIYERGDQVVDRNHATISIILWLFIIYNCLLGWGGYLDWYTTTDATYSYNVIEFLGYVKAFISFIKYVPQAYLNWQRKSTVGWAIGNVLLDFTGGAFSFGQQFVQAYNKDDWGVFTHNLPKLLLAVESMFFDVVFMIQHYILYPDRKDPNKRTYAVLKDEVYAAEPAPAEFQPNVNRSTGGGESTSTDPYVQNL